MDDWREEMSERDIAEACRDLDSALQDSIADTKPIVYAIRGLIEAIIEERLKS